MKLETKEILAWHFLRGDKKIGYGDNRVVTLGETILDIYKRFKVS